MSDSTKKKILMIDDDKALASLMREFLQKYGYQLLSAENAEAGLKEAERFKPDVILLDINLPGASGLDLCQTIRARSMVPIIMISDLGGTSDRIVGLKMGADSYLPKPFDPRELVAHLDAVVRRVETLSVSKGEPVLELGELRVDTSRREAILDGKPLALSSVEFDLLCVLISRPGHVFSRDELMNRLRGIDWEAYNRSVDLLVSRLRRKLGDTPKQCRFLKTVWGTGYVLLPQVTRKAG